MMEEILIRRVVSGINDVYLDCSGDLTDHVHSHAVDPNLQYG